MIAAPGRCRRYPWRRDPAVCSPRSRYPNVRRRVNLRRISCESTIVECKRLYSGCDPPPRLAPLELNHHHPTIRTPHTKPAKMATRARKAKMSLLDYRIDILNRGAIEASSAKQVFETVGTILTLVRVSVAILRPSVDPS